jgi:integrase/recombinase XerC
LTVLDDYLATLERDRYSRATIDARRRILATMPGLLDATREQIQAWWETRQRRDDGELRAASSLAQETSHVRAFYRWAMQQGLVEHNAADWLPKVRTSSRSPKPVQEGDLFELLREAQPPMRQMIALAAMAGLRAAEIGAVRWEDIDRAAGILWVRQGKGRKDRSVPLSSGLLVELGDPREGHIIGRPMTGAAVSIAIKRYFDLCGIDSSAHKLRARYATRFLAATGDLVATAAAMGHSSVATTAMYAIASSDTMRRGAEACGRVG